MKAPKHASIGNGDGGFESPPAGTYGARFIRIIDLGTQDDTYEGQPIEVRKVIIMWELNKMMADNRPFVASKEFRFSMHKNANLRKTIHSLIGKEMTDIQAEAFDFNVLLGKVCMVTMGESATGKIKVTNVFKKIEGQPMLAPVNEQLAVFLDPAEFKQESFDKLSDFWKAKIQNSPEYESLQAPTQSAAASGASKPASDDDIPF
jgi:hypothetical protein